MLYKAPTSKNPEPFESIVFLANVVAPRIGNQNRSEEPFAAEARENIREKIIGRSCDFVVEYEHSGRKYGTLIVNDENINIYMIKSGLAKVLEARGPMATSETYEGMVKAQDEAQKKKTNLWGPLDDSEYAKKHTRAVIYPGDADY
mmetsp:Transcript_20857/g.14979  ORF Transcript_20857/g.14979 Transcript_20857/m.14979 type:complete len:146 (+) Transcript_20857:115-552(+)